MQLILCKDNANERKESLLSISRVQLILCKDNANERKESLLSISRVQLILCKDNASYPQHKINACEKTFTLKKKRGKSTFK